MIADHVNKQAVEVLFKTKLEYKHQLVAMAKKKFKEEIGKFVKEEADKILGSVTKSLCKKAAEKSKK